MNVKSVEKEATRASVTVELTREELEPALNRAYLKYRKDIMIPGFRKGHAPRMVIEAAYGKHVFFEDAVEDMFPDIYKDAVLTQDIRPVGRPSVSKMDIADDGAVTLTIVTDLYPVAELGEYKNLEIEKAEVEVKESEVEAELDRMAQNVARITTVDRPAQEGDTAVIDFEGFVDGEAFEGGKGTDYPLTIGSGAFIPGFEEKLVGAEIGKEVEVDVTFPEEYHAKELAGKPAVFKCTVKEIKVKELPELDDDFAQDVSDFDTLEEYKADVRKKVEEKKAADAKAKKEDAVIEKIIEGATMEIPDAMVETQAERMVDEFAQRLQMQGLTMEQYLQFTGGNVQALVEQSKPQALKRIQSRLVLEAVVAAENLTASDEELDAELGRMAEQYKMEVEKLKEMFTEEDLKSVREDLAIQKAVELVTDAAVEK